MGEFGAGKLILGLVSYFALFIAFMSLFNAVSADYGLDALNITGDESLIGIEQTILSQGGLCEEPRYYVKEGEQVELQVFEDTLLCEFTSGNVDLNTCDGIAGCALVNETFLFFPTGEQYCGGVVNLTSEFGINESTYSFSGGFAVTTPALETLLTTKDQCQFFGFTWNEYTQEQASTLSNDVGLGSITGLVSNLFTFQATFSSNYWVNFILTLILFYLPLIALLVAIYFALPFLH